MRLKRFCVCFFPKAPNAAERSPTSSEASSEDEDSQPGHAIPAAESDDPLEQDLHSAESAGTVEELLQGPRLEISQGSAGRVTAEIQKISQQLADNSGDLLLRLTCLEPAWLRLQPAPEKLAEVSLCDPAGVKAKDEEEMAKLFGLISAFRPRTVELATELKPFIPDFIPAIGEVPCSLSPPRPSLGLCKVDASPSRQASTRRKAKRSMDRAEGLKSTRARKSDAPAMARCRSSGLLLWLRGRIRRRLLKKAGSSSHVRYAPGASATAGAAIGKPRDALVRWLHGPAGRRALRRVQRKSSEAKAFLPTPASQRAESTHQESSDGSWATATEGLGAQGVDDSRFSDDTEQISLSFEVSPGTFSAEDEPSFFSAEAEEASKDDGDDSGGAGSSDNGVEHELDLANLDPDDALEIFFAFMEIFLEHYKENALRSSILEPAKYFFACTGDWVSREKVDLAAAGAHRSLLSVRLGVSWGAPSSSSSDVCMADAWGCLSQAAWDLFLDPAYFGMDFADIPSLMGGPPLICSSSPQPLAEEGRKRLVHQFARHFQVEALLPKVRASLTKDAEAALDVLYERFREDLHVPETSLALHCWPQEALDLGRFARFLAWLGVVRWTEELLEQHYASPKVDICPICYEEKLDVECLEHWNPKGDVSEHRMCGSCRFEYGQSQCPFCKEPLLPEELIDFIDKLGASIREDGRHDLFEVSIVLEEWQMHEMQFEAEPSVMRRAARLLVEDRNFRERFSSAVTMQRRSWLCAAAGPVFRLWGFDQAKPLCPGLEVSALLQDAIELLLSPLERFPEAEDATGFIYSQALVAWFCAFRQDEANASALAKLVRRIGWALVLSHARLDPLGRWRLCEDLRGNTPPEHFELSHAPIWGSKAQDIVWQTFCV